MKKINWSFAIAAPLRTEIERLVSRGFTPEEQKRWNEYQKRIAKENVKP